MTSQASVLWSDEDLSVNLPPSRHVSFHVWQEDFPALKGGGGFSFLCDSSRAEFRKREVGSNTEEGEDKA